MFKDAQLTPFENTKLLISIFLLALCAYSRLCLISLHALSPNVNEASSEHDQALGIAIIRSSIRWLSAFPDHLSEASCRPYMLKVVQPFFNKQKMTERKLPKLVGKKANAVALDHIFYNVELQGISTDDVPKKSKIVF